MNGRACHSFQLETFIYGVCRPASELKLLICHLCPHSLIKGVTPCKDEAS